eukprot:636259-Prorocentrum_minimum.AAC.1
MRRSTAARSYTRAASSSLSKLPSPSRHPGIDLILFGKRAPSPHSHRCRPQHHPPPPRHPPCLQQSYACVACRALLPLGHTHAPPPPPAQSCPGACGGSLG